MLLLQLLVNGAVNAAVYALLAVGFGLIYRSMRFFHVAFGASYVIASYAAVAAISRLPAPAVAICGLAAALVSGALMEIVVFAPLRRRNASVEVLFVASLGLYVLAVNTIALVFGNEVQILSTDISTTFTLGGISLTAMQIAQFVCGWLTVGGLWFVIRKHSFFKALWALGETPELITALGFPVGRMRVFAFGLGALMAGAAALLTAFDIGADPYAGMGALLTGAVAVLVGGYSRYWGWIGGAAVLAVLQAVAVWQFSSRWNDLITFAILVLTLLWRPSGLFTPRTRKEEQ